MNRRYLVPVFLGAFLLFLLQPMAGKSILPRFGGTPAVWTTCMLFFQTLLLAGYAYAHGVVSRLGARSQRVLHIGLLLASLAVLAGFDVPTKISDPVLSILILLLSTIGFPYFMLATTGPLMQAWAAQSGAAPYRLYAASNAASFLALLSYPVGLEPWISLEHQFWIWRAGYVAYAAVAIWCALSGKAAPLRETLAGRPAPREILHWTALAACGSTMLLATTNQICQEVAVIPFLWILPLAIYLLTFTLCFDSDRWYDRGAWGLAAAVLAPAACALLGMGSGAPIRTSILVDAAALAAVCMLCHGELACSRPEPERLTYFYLAIAGGGALGGFFVTVVAPRVFNSFTEFPLAMAAACVLTLNCWRREGLLWQFARESNVTRYALAGLAMAALLSLFMIGMQAEPGALAAVRNFYGVLRVYETGQPPMNRRSLVHGGTLHGFQYLDPEKRLMPVAYYPPGSGLGLAMIHHPKRTQSQPLRAGIIGLGTGMIAIYGHPGDAVRFYEINPDVDRLSSQYFTYRRDSAATVEIVPGDARLTLAAETPRNYDVLVVDAFTSDAIPVHLLTRECAAIYRRHLQDDGLLVFNISNRSVDIAPVVRAIAARLGWRAARVVSPADESLGIKPAIWVIVSRNEAFWNTPQVRRAVAVSAWEAEDRAPLEWTDDFSSLWRVLK